MIIVCIPHFIVQVLHFIWWPCFPSNNLKKLLEGALCPDLYCIAILFLKHVCIRVENRKTHKYRISPIEVMKENIVWKKTYFRGESYMKTVLKAALSSAFVIIISLSCGNPNSMGYICSLRAWKKACWEKWKRVIEAEINQKLQTLPPKKRSGMPVTFTDKINTI